MNLYAIIGNPVNHSKSPAIMNAAFEALNMDCKYVKIASNSIEEAMQTMQDLELSGANVTAPYKETIIPFLDEMDEAAITIGSVNTIVFENERIKGYNTDYLGVVNSLNEINVNLENKKILVLGAGGAAKAVIYGLVKEKASVTLTNRTLDKAQLLAHKFNISVFEFELLENRISEFDIIINTIPSDKINFSISYFDKNQILFDANYVNSQLEKIASQLGNIFINGKQWLLNQAYPAFEIFSKKIAPKEDMSNAIEGESKPKNISLVGFMGSGKTSLGKELSKKLKYKFVDIDKEIEKKENLSVRKIFEIKGETYFREREKQFLEEVLQEKNQVISCGGGIVEDPQNRKHLKESALNIWLYADIQKSIIRMRDNKRPLLNVENKEEKAVNLFRDRKNYYAALSDIIFNTTNFNKVQISNKIYEEISFSI